tara:strand:+ start:204 stop:425 length:222 start_codon:yes stop_codon:yes gene_type:complete
MTPRESAQIEADRTFSSFVRISKITTYGAVAFFIAVASCNFGVEDGPNATGSGYDGSVYAPSNLNGCYNFKCP